MTPREQTTYTIGRALGRGGFATVYDAVRSSEGGLTTRVAIKVLHAWHAQNPKLLRRLRDEARLLGLMDHENIVDVRDLIRIDEAPAIVLSLIPGIDLAFILREYGPLPEPVALEIIEVVAATLQYAWTTEVEGRPFRLVHRDIKPGNILVTPQGQVRILDFGISRAEFPHRESQTQAGRMGTPGYTAPECTKKASEARHESDVYGLAVTLAELVSGVCPEPSSGRPTDHAAWQPELLDRLRGMALQERLVEVVKRGTAFDPDDRPNARSFKRDLRILRRSLKGPDLREWSEAHIPRLNAMREAGLQKGPLTGRQFTPRRISDAELISSSEADASSSSDELRPVQAFLGRSMGASNARTEASSHASSHSETFYGDSSAGHASSADKSDTWDGDAEPTRSGGDAALWRHLSMFLGAVMVLVLAGQTEAGRDARRAATAFAFPVFGWEVDFVSASTGYRFVEVAGGHVQLGPPADDPSARPDEVARETDVGELQVGMTEVTQAMWSIVMQDAPIARRHTSVGTPCAHHAGIPMLGPNLPVHCISWHEAVTFANRLSARDGFEPPYAIEGASVRWNRDASGYRLPTEAEWSWIATSAEGSAPWSGALTPEEACVSGNIHSRVDSAEIEAPPDRAFPCDDAHFASAPVGSYRADANGVFDLTGNVAEWVWDVYEAAPTAALVDHPAAARRRRVHRGGSWRASPAEARAWARDRAAPDVRSTTVGLRLVRGKGPVAE